MIDMVRGAGDYNELFVWIVLDGNIRLVGTTRIAVGVRFSRLTIESYAPFQLIAAVDPQKCVPLLPWVPLRVTALKSKDFDEYPETLGEHLRKRRKQLALTQREAGRRMGVTNETVANWEKDKTKPITAQFERVLAFLGYDPTPTGDTLAERLDAKRRSLGVTLDQVATYLGWDASTLSRDMKGRCRTIPPERQARLETLFNNSPADLANLLGLPRRRRRPSTS